MKKEKKFSKIIMLFFLTFLLQSCSSEEKKEIVVKEGSSGQNSKCPKHILENKDQNLNISILLDLSDRIEQPKIISKDSAYLSSLSKALINHVKHKKLIMLEDKMQLFFNPEPKDSKVNEIAKKLKLSFTRETSKASLEDGISLYSDYPSQLYSLSKEDAKKSKGYPGSDIWRFFKDHVEDYCMDDCHRNILVVLTDGYMYHYNTVMKSENFTSYLTQKSLKKLKLNKSTWKKEIEKRKLGFIPVGKDLKNLEVLVIGIENHNTRNPYAKDIIEKYWSDWFDSMNIKNYKIKSADIPSSIEKVIFDFINK
ncbi:hypothetical protein KCTC32516_01797 [Polaribacter huanghezhanensis]|uniref:hypothetical protein n=1 Tax=Polaribacter huanghezhanensis TaxID=1354726 RepID=UPI002649BA88|nr:hypothetical protein [Polaribacter huanghezhanensis]WKD86422.1 hypothetical protein KCTC32516_01797 [Polaribacter huanghezhanensis]